MPKWITWVPDIYFPVISVERKPFLLSGDHVNACCQEGDSSCCRDLGARDLRIRWLFSRWNCLLGAKTVSPLEPRLAEVTNTRSFLSGLLGTREAGPLGPEAPVVFLSTGKRLYI